MQKPSRLDVLPIVDFGDREFGEWLYSGLAGYYLQGLDGSAFKPLGLFFGVGFHIVEDVQSVYDELLGQEKRVFKKGIAIALAIAPTDDQHLPVVEAILNIAGVVGATEVLDVLISKLRPRYSITDDSTSAIFNLAVRTVAKLSIFAGNTSLTEVCISNIEELARSSLLPSRSAISLFILLCKLRPDAIGDNMLLFRQRLDAALDIVEDTVEEDNRVELRRSILEEVKKVADAASLFVSLSSLSFRCPNALGYDWWQSLLSGVPNLSVTLIELLKHEPQSSPVKQPKFRWLSRFRRESVSASTNVDPPTEIVTKFYESIDTETRH